MNLYENTKNAFNVVKNTYESIDKLLTELDRIGNQCGFTSITPRFLRWKTDIDCGGWLTTSFIKLYQDKQDPDLENGAGMKDGFIYGIEINLWDGPQIIFSRYKFENLINWTAPPSVSEHWRFFHPIRGTNGNFKISPLSYEGVNYHISGPNDSPTTKKYWNLQQVVYRYDSLLDLTSKNISTKVFDAFKVLAKVEASK